MLFDLILKADQAGASVTVESNFTHWRPTNVPMYDSPSVSLCALTCDIRYTGEPAFSEVYFFRFFIWRNAD